MRWISFALGVIFTLDMLSHRTVDEVAFFQVGQGDAALISKAGSNILVDTGPRNDYFDGGQRFVWPELHRRGIRRLDAVFLTHFDRDHYGGLAAILERVQVDRVIIVDVEGVSSVNLAILETLGVRSDQLVIIRSAELLNFGSFKVEAVPGLTGNDNFKSPFLAVNYGVDRVILTGDAPSEVEKYWSKLGLAGGRILKAGHHGSDKSLGMNWLEIMDPQYVVFSCGRNNVWGHPSFGALGRAKQSGASVLRTDSMGTLRFMPDATGRLHLVSREDRAAVAKFFQR